jgi:hypothetical protein
MSDREFHSIGGKGSKPEPMEEAEAEPKQPIRPLTERPEKKAFRTALSRNVVSKISSHRDY